LQSSAFYFQLRLKIVQVEGILSVGGHSPPYDLLFNFPNVAFFEKTDGKISLFAGPQPRYPQILFPIYDACPAIQGNFCCLLNKRLVYPFYKTLTGEFLVRVREQPFQGWPK